MCSSDLGGTTPGKAPKLTTSPGSDCNVLTGEEPPVDPSAISASPNDDSPVPPAAGVALFLRVRVVANGGATNIGTFCTTDRVAYPKWLTNQEVIFTGATKVKTKTKFAAVKKLKLTAPISSSIPLDTIGAHVIYGFDKTVMTATRCEVSAAKAAGKSNTCTISNTNGTVRVDGNDTGTIKPGKPIISPTLTVEFTYTGTPGSTSLTLLSSSTDISLGGQVVAVTVDDTADCTPSGGLSNADIVSGVGAGNPENVCYAGQGTSDPNYQRPIITITGLA